MPFGGMCYTSFYVIPRYYLFLWYTTIFFHYGLIENFFIQLWGKVRVAGVLYAEKFWFLCTVLGTVESYLPPLKYPEFFTLTFSNILAALLRLQPQPSTKPLWRVHRDHYRIKFIFYIPHTFQSLSYYWN